jgi:hypothetical protein
MASTIRSFAAPAARASLLLSAALLVAQVGLAQAPALPRPATQIAAATLPLPEAMRAGATVLGYRSAAKLELLRQGNNGMICLAHNPADVDRFHVACYHESLDPFMARGRALRAEGVSTAQIDTIRFAEVRSGALKMPVAGALYSLTGPAGDFDEAKVAAPKSRPLFVVYMPGATQASTGISTVPLVGQPWLMLPGTPKAHLMFTPTM